MQRWWHGLLALNPQEREQVGIDEVRMSSAQTMRRSGNELQFCTLDQFCSENRCVIHRHNLIRLAVDKESWYIDLFEVLRKIVF